MIPKIIHYVWFSDSPNYPDYVLRCFDTWKEVLSDYEIKLWNADNFDLTQCRYAQEAYDEKKYAFASDYVRLKVLHEYGGIYLDSDVEVYKSLDDLLCNRAFTGFEDKDKVAPWILACEQGNPIIKEFLDEYNNRRFIIAEGQYDTTPNPIPISKCLKKHGLKMNGKTQELENIKVYSEKYFCPYNPYRKEVTKFSEIAYTNHLFNGAWLEVCNEKEKKYKEAELKFKKRFGTKIGAIFFAVYNVYKTRGLRRSIIYFLKDELFKFITNKIKCLSSTLGEK